MKIQPQGVQEIVDIVDRKGQVLQQALKSEAHTHGLLHKTVIGHLRDGNRWSLVRQSLDRQDVGQLVSPVGGHVRAGEKDIDALLRESEEEIGTRSITYKLIGQAIFRRQIIGRDENHLFIVYEITTTDPIVLGGEAESIESFTEHELKQNIIETPESFGNAYYFVLENFYPEYLPSTWVKHCS